MKIKTRSFYQHSIFSALMQGQLSGSLDFNELLKHGNFGLGTFDATDGELIILDGTAYQMLSSGRVNQVNPTKTTPFAAVTNFESDLTLSFNNITFHQLEEKILAKLPSLNFFYAVKITGSFNDISFRTLTKQERPFVSLKTAVKDQKELMLKNISGNLVMFYTPKFANNIMVQAFHAHFISQDRKSGGHVFEFDAENITVEVCCLTNMNLHLPVTEDFLNYQFDDNNLQQEIKQVESQRKMIFN